MNDTYNHPGKYVVLFPFFRGEEQAQEGKVTSPEPPGQVEVGLEPTSVISRQCVFHEVSVREETMGWWQEWPFPLCRGFLSQPAARKSPVGLSQRWGVCLRPFV